MPLKRWINRPRIESFDYTGNRAYHVTLVTRGREPILRGALATTVVSALSNATNALDATLLAYCIMPDHLHLLVHMDESRSSLVRLVQRFKHRTSYDYIQQAGERLWQPSFHDHVLRNHEELTDVARYIFGNPVKGGLATHAGEWAHSGGTLFESLRAPS